MENADLQFHDAALKLIAKKAIARKIGARGLRATIENILLDTMYELPSMEDVQTVVVDESVVNGIQSPILVYADEEKKAV
jgi:ATP-dependent Clp protease ATP-binding subunit ClpX